MPPFKGFNARHFQRPGLERAHACGDEDGARQAAHALCGFHQKAPVGLPLKPADLLAQMKHGLEGRNLLHQRLGQLAARAHGHGGNVVDGLVGIQLHRLAAHLRQCVNDVGARLQQAQLEHLKQPHRPCADDDGVGFKAVGGGFGHGHGG